VTEVVTGEAVVLDVPCAQFPSRLAALLLDMVVQLSALAVVIVVIVTNSARLDAAEVAAILVSAYVVIVAGYPTVFETLTRGKTLGKMALGLRVVSDDGGAVRFRQALVRGLTGAIEIWTIVGAPIGLILSMVSAKGKRLGDMFAGTYVIQERAPRRPDLPPALAMVPPPLLGWAQVAEISRLSDQNAEAASSYLRRLYELRPAARDELGLRIATAVASQVSPPPPPGTPPAAYLAAVLAIRRDREFARLARQQSATPGTPGAWPQPPGGPPPAAWPQPPGGPPPAAWPPAGPGPVGAASAPGWPSPPAAAAPPPGTWNTPPGAPPPYSASPPSAPPHTAPPPGGWTTPPGAPGAAQSPGAWPPPPAPSSPSSPSSPPGTPAAPGTPPAPYTPTVTAAPPPPADQDQRTPEEPASGGFAPPA
jgi:uncharacterized RDD family membrane protein YckC